MFEDQHAQAEQAERAKKRQRLERERACQRATQAAEEHYAAYVNGLATDLTPSHSTDPSTDPNRFKTPYGNRDHSRPIRLHKLTHKLEPFEHSLPHEAPSTPTAPFAEAVVTDAPGKPRSALVKDFQYAVAYKTPASSSSPAQHKLFAVARQPMPLAQWTAFFETPNVRESPLSAFTANLENYKQTALRNGGYFDDLNLATISKKTTTKTTTTVATKAKPATNLSVQHASTCTAHTFHGTRWNPSSSTMRTSRKWVRVQNTITFECTRTQNNQCVRPLGKASSKSQCTWRK
jgi:hypothetical protein